MPHGLVAELDDLARLDDLRARQRAAPEEQVRLAGEPPRAVDNDDGVALQRRTDDLHLPALDDEEGNGRVTDVDEHVAARHRAQRALARDLVDLLRRQRREHERLVGGAHARHYLDWIGHDGWSDIRVSM